MADEKKYLVNIESNLKEYADLAVEAKKKVDELTIANLKLQASETATAAEKEASLAALKNANDEYRKSQSLLKTAIANNQAEAGSRKQLSAQLKLQEQALGKLENAYIKDAQGIMRLNPAYTEQRNQIAATKQKIIEYDLALNDGRSNIGRYGEAVGSAMKSAAASMFAFAAPIAVATAALNGLKEAFLGTEKGAKLLSLTKMQLSAFFESIITGDFKYAFGKQLPKDIEAAANLMDQIRIDERKELTGIEERELEIKNLRLDSVKAGKGSVEQEQFLIKAIEKEDELITFKLSHKEEELTAVNLLLEHQKTNTVLLNKQAQLEAEIFSIKGEKSLRMATKLQTIEEKKIADAEKVKEKELVNAKKEYDDEQKRIKENQKALQKEVDDYIAAKDAEFEASVEFQRKLFEHNKKEGQREYDAKIAMEEAMAEQIINIHETLNDSKMSLAASATNFLNSIAGENKALQNASLIADKAFAIAEIVIQTVKSNAVIRATAAASVLPGPGYLVRLAASMAAVTVPINLNRIAAALDIAAIIAATISGITANSKSSTPSSGIGNEYAPTSISASIPAQRTFANPAGSTLLTQPQLSQQQLNALPQTNLLTADDIARALSRMPPPVVTVEDINAKIDEVNKVKVRSNI